MNRSQKGIVFLAVFFVCVSAVLCTKAGASGLPDPDTMESVYLLDHRRIFQGAGDEYLVLSTNGTRTNITRITGTEGNWKAKNYATAAFAYEEASPDGVYLYFAGNSTDPAEDLPCVRIMRFDIETHKTKLYTIANTGCDFTRGFLAQDGKLYLVVEQSGLPVTDDTPVSIFDGLASESLLYAEGTLEDFPAESSEPPISESEPPSEPPESSEPPASEPKPSSEPPESSEPPASEPEPSSEPPESNEPPVSEPETPSEPSESSEPPEKEEDSVFRFDGPLTITELKQSFSEHEGDVRITGAMGREKLIGSVCTGDIITIVIDGQEDSRVCAIIPGDLRGVGKPGKQDLRVLAEYIAYGPVTYDAYWEAADLNDDGAVDTRDLLALKRLLDKG